MFSANYVFTFKTQSPLTRDISKPSTDLISHDRLSTAQLGISNVLTPVAFRVSEPTDAVAWGHDWRCGKHMEGPTVHWLEWLPPKKRACNLWTSGSVDPESQIPKKHPLQPQPASVLALLRVWSICAGETLSRCDLSVQFLELSVYVL